MHQSDPATSHISYGGKADNLIRLRRAGFAVPWFTLIRQDQQEEAAARLIAKLDPAKRYAVRSSASLEDQTDTAMAGLFQTFLDVPVQAIPEKVQLCFDSAQSSRVADFILAKELDWDGAMTVIVQEMVESELSGVLFTANPQGILNEMMAAVGKGQGIGVVEDRVAVTTLIHHDQDDVDLIASQPGAPEVPKGSIAELTALGRRLRAEFPYPVDAEFAFAGGRLWVLQARPITGLDTARVTVLDNSNISESYPGITLPLSIDFAKTAYAGIFSGLMARIFGSQLPGELIPILDEMVTSSSGRMYYQINHWYQIMKLLPLSSAYIKVWQEMMGVRQRRIAQAEIRLRPIDRLRGLLRLSRALVRTPGEMQRLDRDFQAFRSRYDGMQLQAMKRPELAEVYDLMKAELLGRWDVTLLNDIHAFIFTALLKKVRRDGSQGGQAQLTQLGEVESLKPVSLLRRMARVAPRELLALDTSESVRGYLERDEPFSEILRDYLADYGDRYLEELKLESKTFRTDPVLLVEMLRRLKDPDGSQADTVDPSQEEDQGKDKDINKHMEKDKDIDNDKDEDEDIDKGKPPMGLVRIRQTSHGQVSRKSAERGLSGMIYRRAADAIRQREISRLNRTRIFGMARAIFLGLGRELAASGELAEAEDVFWLTQAEAFSGGEGLKAIVLGRQAMYQAFARLPMLSRLEFAGDVFDRTLPGNVTAQGNDGGSLIADGASPGIARGQILLVADPRLAADFTGRILVTRQTDPGWVFLITQAAGIIAEKGSLLSHTAIIARELGKPVVVGLTGALHRFRDGEWVEINGSTGEIRRLDQ